MKTTLQLIFSIALIFSFTIFCNAQDAMVEVDATQIHTENDEAKIEEKSKLSSKQIYINQTQKATNQMIQHLAKNISYPDHLQDQYIEGEVIVEVLINKRGKIQEAKVFKSLQGDLDQLVLTTVLELAKINVENKQYKGARRLRIPVDFTFR